MALALTEITRDARLRRRALSLQGLRLLFGVCAYDPGVVGVRDAALLAVLYGAGLRACETVAFDFADYDAAEAVFQLSGSGPPMQTAYLAPGAGAALEAWVAVRGNQPGPLFWACDAAGTHHPERLTPRALAVAVRRRGREAGLGAVTPQDLRCTFLSDLLSAGVDRRVVAALAREPSPYPTAPDTLADRAARRDAVARIHVPYRPRVGEAM
jgi:site-specific recombinase XerD